MFLFMFIFMFNLLNNFFNARALRVSTLKLNFNVKITFEFLLKQKNKKKIFSRTR